MSGTVEADETFISGKASNMHEWKRKQKIQGRGGVGKTIVMGILERHGEVRAKVVPNRDGETLQGVVRENVEQGANVYTDSLPSYFGLSSDFIHEFVNHTEEYVRGAVHTNGIENFWNCLKRGLKGTYTAVTPEHLFRYVDEQVFRLNNRKGKDAERFLLTCLSISGRRLTYKKLTGKTLFSNEGSA